jgi:hypothetical protein
MKVLAGLMSLGLSGCSFLAFARPVVVPPPGGGDPLTTVGATVRCRSSSWPMALDVLGAGTAVVSAALAVGTVEFLQAMSDERDEHASTMAAVVFLVPAGFLMGSAVYGGMRAHRCREALTASARAKLRGEPLHLEGVDYEAPMGAMAPSAPMAPPGAAAPRRAPPPGPPQSVAQPPLPPEPPTLPRW